MNPPNKNTFLTYCKEYEESNEEGGAEWDLDMDEDADFVWFLYYSSSYSIDFYLIYSYQFFN